MYGLLRSTEVIAYREVLRFFQQRSRLVASVAVPLLFLLLLGGGLRLAAGQLDQGDGFLQFVFPAFIVITVVTSSLATGLSMVWDREFGFMRVVLTAPISRTGIILGKVLGGAIVAFVQGAALAVLAPVIGIDAGPIVLLKVLPLLLLLSLSVSSLGVLAGSRLRSQQGFLVVIQVLVLVLVFFSGTFVPLENLPGWMQAGAAVNPVHYGVDALRQTYLTDPAAIAPFTFEPTASVLVDSAVIAGTGVAFMAGAVWLFARER